MSLVGVECNADRYFFGRLLENKNIIRKERNDFEVINGVANKSRGNFSIGIIDVDKQKKLPTEFQVIFENDNSKIYKHITNFQFLILVGPRQLEHFLNEFLRTENKEITEFGFTDFNHFMETSKSLKPEMNVNFKCVIDFIIDNFANNNNHINTLKKQINFIIEEKYNFRIEDFNNIK